MHILVDLAYVYVMESSNLSFEGQSILTGREPSKTFFPWLMSNTSTEEIGKVRRNPGPDVSSSTFLFLCSCLPKSLNNIRRPLIYSLFPYVRYH